MIWKTKRSSYKSEGEKGLKISGLVEGFASQGGESDSIFILPNEGTCLESCPYKLLDIGELSTSTYTYLNYQEVSPSFGSCSNIHKTTG